MIARRLLMGGGGAFTVLGPLVAVGGRTTIASSAYNGFPGMTFLTGDDLYLVYRYGSAHNSAAGEMDSRTSTDGGVTWPAGGTTVATIAAPNDLRDPCILRTSSGRLLLVYDRRQPYNSSNIDSTRIYSDDGGATWSANYTIPTAYSGPEVAVTTSQAVETAGATIVLPGFAQDASGLEFVVMWQSTDDGATFGAASVIASSGSIDYQEPQLRILASGRWLMLMRSESNHHTWRTYSDDAGATWSAPDDVNAMTGRPDFVEYRPGRLAQFGRYLTSGDSSGYFAISSDGGATWSTPAEIDVGETDFIMYSAPVVVSAGTVVIVYCLESSSSTSGIYFRTFADT